jgi:hypothetical protein
MDLLIQKMHLLKLQVLIHHFMLFSDERITLEADEIAQTESYDEESLHMRQLLKTKLVDMDLSSRSAHENGMPLPTTSLSLYETGKVLKFD